MYGKYCHLIFLKIVENERMKDYIFIWFLAQTPYMAKFLFLSYFSKYSHFEKYSLQSDLRIFLTVTSQERVEGLWRFFSCSWKLLWKLQIYYVVLVGCGQACLDMPEVCRQRTNNQCFCINLRDSVDFSDPVGQLWKFSHPFGENGCGQVCLGCLKLLRSSLWTTSQE